MFRLNRAFLALALALVIIGGVSAAFAQEPPSQPNKPVWINPFRGTAEVQYLNPIVRREKDMVVTTIQVKNMATGPIARLTIEEFWYDKSGNPVTGDKQFVKKPLMPGEITTIVLHTPVNPRMDRNQLTFSHQNGGIKPKKVAKFE